MGNLYITSSPNGTNLTSFTTPQNLNNISKNGPSLTVFNGKIYMAFTGEKGHLNVCSLAPDTKWESPVVSENTSNNSPSLAAFTGQNLNECLYMAFTGTNNSLYICSSEDAEFNNKIKLNNTSYGSPSLAVFQGRLYMAFTGTNQSLYIWSSSDGKFFENQAKLSNTSSCAPSLAVFKGQDGIERLYMAFTAVGSHRYLSVWSSVDGTTFDQPIIFTDHQSYVSPSITAFKDLLYIAFTGPDNSINIASSSDGRNFGHYLILPLTSAAAPSLAGLDDLLYWSFPDRSYPQTAPPSLDDYFNNWSWSYTAEQVIAGALGIVPEVGSMLSALVYVFWPQGSASAVWSQVEAQTEALIGRNLDRLVKEQCDASLEGLYNNMNEYLVALGTQDAASIARKWDDANSQFVQQLPTFRLPDYQSLLLTDYVQLCNMHLSLLRDGVLNGASWGWYPGTVENTQYNLSTCISTYTEYVQKVYETMLDGYVINPDDKTNYTVKWNERNAFVRQMTRTLLDFVSMWRYFDISNYQNPVTVYLDSEIYSDVCGSNTDSGPLIIPAPPTQPISKITVWGGGRIDAVQVTYPVGGGPGGVTFTARMGDASGGTNSPPDGGIFNVTDNPVAVANAGAGGVIEYMFFTFANGVVSNKLGGNARGQPDDGHSIGGHDHISSYFDQILSSIYINGISKLYGSADCVVFGFKYRNPMKVDLPSGEMMFIASPKEPAFATLAIAPVKWQQKRKAYWDRMKADAKA